MNRLLCFGAAICCALGISCSSTLGADVNRELYEVRSYLLGENGDPATIDQYLKTALLPALKRQQIGPIGVFTNAPQDESGVHQIVLVIPYADAAAMLGVESKLAKDAEYQQAAKSYLALGPQNPPYQRIRSELLTAMDCWPQVKVPDGSLDNAQRVYELRLYESPTEHIGALKVEMFNAGEVPIFLDAGIQPIFIGSAIVGPQTPSLTYLTMYPDEAARGAAWNKFREHADWKVLSAQPKYQGTVNRIDKYVLIAKPYSEM